jgi:phospholipase/carboxylesterase
VARALPAVEAMVRAEQARYGVAPADTVMCGFSQGAIISLSLAAQHDGLVGRVLSFSGRFAALPVRAPQHTTLHFFHGELDPVIDVRHAREAFARLQQTDGDATLDVANVGHELAPELAQQAIVRLQAPVRQA